MKSIQKVVGLSLFILVAFMTIDADSTESPQYSSVREVVNEYCRSEFNGIVAIRQDLTIYSRKREIEEKKRDPELMGQVIGRASDPLFIVSAYKIIDIKLEKNKAVASVDYVRLARTEGRGTDERKIIPDYNEHDILLLNLILEKGKWKIIDPPLPRISKDAILNFYKDEKKQMEENVINNPKAKPSEPQKQYYVKVKENLEVVENLGKK